MELEWVGRKCGIITPYEPVNGVNYIKGEDAGLWWAYWIGT